MSVFRMGRWGPSPDCLWSWEVPWHFLRGMGCKRGVLWSGF
uniref:Uncharacterized protein n=1 Tax=Anguilla anguilla TaxID=7936 RepID=A0A0E9QM39_ANGAN